MTQTDMTPVPYAKSPVFDEHSLPHALRKEHRTKDGTWGLLQVLEGEVELVFLNPPQDRRVKPGNPAHIPPQSPHFVKLLGPMKMQVEFHHSDPFAQTKGCGK
jgi:tellurite resistance-related uncharacterized protein